MKPQITLILDLSEVLILGIKGIEKKISAILNLPEDEIRNSILNDNLFFLFKGYISEDEYLSKLLTDNRWELREDELKQIIRANFHIEMLGMLQILYEIHCEFRLVLLSDHAQEWVEYIKKIHPFLKLFDEIIFSFEIGKLKSEAETFGMVLSILDVSAGECVFFDDSMINIANAEKWGIQSYLYQNVEQFKTIVYSLL